MNTQYLLYLQAVPGVEVHFYGHLFLASQSTQYDSVGLASSKVFLEDEAKE
jgi:hypothetical protein